MNSFEFLGFSWLRPDDAIWLLVTPVFFLFGAWAVARRRRELARFVDLRHMQRFAPGQSRYRPLVRVCLATGAAGFLVLAMLGPVRGYSLRDVERKGLDLVVCLDSSRSMLVEDLRPNRLERAKREIRGLLQKLEGDRVAVLAFAGDVRKVAPLTHDRKTLASFVDTISPKDNALGGTNLGAALTAALEVFDGRTGSHEAIVLLTDGEDLEGQGLEVAKVASERGIRIYVVGMGTLEGGKISNGSAGFVRDEAGTEVVSSLDGSTLEAIAEVSGGAYLSASRSALPLEELYEKRMQNLETRALWAGREKIPHDRYQWPLFIALLCMMSESALRDRKATEDNNEA
jgi:Ca-activated chloride channel family protein